VAVVDKVVDKKGTRTVAEAYLKYLYSEEAQRIAGKNFYRPTDAKVAAEFAGQFPSWSCSPSTRLLAAGQRQTRLTLPTAAASIRSTPRNK
jgi:ABC-type sulfate transport system substrate-binding protein